MIILQLINRLILVLLFSSLIHANSVVPQYEIDIKGQKYFEEAVIQDALGVKTKSILEFWKDDIPTISAKLIPSLIDALESFYSSEGFYDANFTINQENNSTIFVTIKENKPIIIDDINISSDYNISHLINVKKGDVFGAKRFISIKTSIKTKLLDDGYCSYDLDTKAFVDLDKKRVNLRYVLKKGGICTFGKVNITAPDNIDKDVILSRVRALEGKRFDRKLVQETSNNLYRLNAFDSVIINVDRKFYNVVPVDINLTQMRNPYHTELGVGYDSYLGRRIHAEIIKNNFLGNAQRLKLKSFWSNKEQLISLSFYRPSILSLWDYHIDFGASIGYSNLEFDGFQEDKSYIKGFVKYDDGKTQLRVGLASERIIINGVDNLSKGTILNQAINEGTFVLFYPYGNLIYDARDSKLNPKHGFYLSAYAEMGLSDEEEASAYLKTLFEGRIIDTFGDLTLAVVGKIGVIKKEIDSGLPESKYFFGGGVYSNRAYGYRSMGVILSPTEDSIYGASSIAVVSKVSPI